MGFLNFLWRKCPLSILLLIVKGEILVFFYFCVNVRELRYGFWIMLQHIISFKTLGFNISDFNFCHFLAGNSGQLNYWIPLIFKQPFIVSVRFNLLIFLKHFIMVKGLKIIKWWWFWAIHTKFLKIKHWVVIGFDAKCWLFTTHPWL